ncbi:hypothetical protein [Natrinema caseinilyticum]|uniref:hypothetical protein n=1 Tax=Natrinema caseinilyticum TaxID=2961570 RepID=UPI003CCD273F
MATSDSQQVSFSDSDTRRDEMQSTIEAWIDDLLEAVTEAVSSDEFQRWLDTQSRFYDYSPDCSAVPHATRVAGYRT